MKRFGIFIGYLTLFFSLGGGIFWCIDPSHMPITNVKFVGQRNHISEQMLREAVLAEINAGFLRLKVSTLQQQLLSLAWVKQVDIRKIWPNTLVIHFEEHCPMARWDDKGLLSAEGILFYPETQTKAFAQLPHIRGPKGRNALVWQQYMEIKALLQPLNVSIMQLELAERGAWEIKLSNGITVVLGTKDILKRLKRFVDVYQKQLHERINTVAYVDLRYTSGMAIGWKST